MSALEVSALITAMSVAGSVPTMVAGALVPSSNRTWIWPPASASPTTWLLVMIMPSWVSTTPEPSPRPDCARTSIDTTLGNTLSATASTVPSGACPSGWVMLTGEARPPSEPPATLAPTQPPRPPETSMAATIPTTSIPRPDFRSVSGACPGAIVCGPPPAAGNAEVGWAPAGGGAPPGAAWA